MGQILTFSRQGKIEKKNVDVSAVVREVLNLLRASLPGAIELRDAVCDEECTVIGDPTQLHRVITNLATNAQYAMEDAGGVLDIRVDSVIVDTVTAARHANLREGPYVKLTVKDTASGIPADVKENIFEPFFTTRLPEKGTGLGLSVAHGIVKSHGGAITVASELDREIEFAVYLPRIDASKSKPAPAVTPAAVGVEHVLLVDDDEAVLASVKQVLETAGFRVTSRTSGRGALDLLRDEPDRYDLLFSDITMPRMTGIQLAREVIAIRPELPIVLGTGFVKMVTEAQVEKIGVRKLIGKPYRPADLTHTIRQALDYEHSKPAQHI